MNRSILSLSIGLLVFSLQVWAQTRPQDIGKPPAKPRQDELSQSAASDEIGVPLRILSTLEDVAIDARKWKDARAAALAQAEVADLLWEARPDTARGVLIRSWDSADSFKETSEEVSRYRNHSAKLSLQTAILLVAKRRAPDLAKLWIDQLEKEKGEKDKSSTRGVFDDRTKRSTVLLNLALAAVQDNPQAAAELAIESLSDGISFGFQNVLLALQEKSFDLAQKVFRAALISLSSQGMTDPNELLVLASYLYTPGRIIGPNSERSDGHTSLAVGRNRKKISSAASLDPSLSTDFLQLAGDLLLNAPPPSGITDPVIASRTLLMAINVLVGKIAETQPEKAAALRSRAQGLTAGYSSVSQMPPANTVVQRQGEISSDYVERQTEHLKKIADAESGTLNRDIAWAKAALSTSEEMYEKGWSLAGKIQDWDLKTRITNFITYRAALFYFNKGELDMGDELCRKNADTAQQAVCLVIGSQEAVKSQDLQKARRWLMEAGRLAKDQTGDEEWARIALGVVSGYGTFDTEMAYSAMWDAVTLINSISTGTFDEEQAPKIKRFGGFQIPDFTIQTQGFGISSALSGFRREDFDRVINLLRDVRSPELRGRMMIIACRTFYVRKGSAQTGNKQ